MSSATDERVEVTAVQGRVEVDVAAHEHSLVVRCFRGWPTYLVHTVIKHLQERGSSF